MSQENVEIIKRVQPSGIDWADLFRAAFRVTTATPDPATTGIDPTAFEFDFETEFIASQAGSMRPACRGLQGFAEAWQDWLEPWESYYIEVEEFIDAGDEVVS